MLETREFKGGGAFRGMESVAEAATRGSAQESEEAVQTWVIEPHRGTRVAAVVWSETLTWERNYLTAEDDPVLAELWDNADDAIFDDL